MLIEIQIKIPNYQKKNIIDWQFNETNRNIFKNKVRKT